MQRECLEHECWGREIHMLEINYSNYSQVCKKILVFLSKNTYVFNTNYHIIFLEMPAL